MQSQATVKLPSGYRRMTTIEIHALRPNDKIIILDLRKLDTYSVNPFTVSHLYDDSIGTPGWGRFNFDGDNTDFPKIILGKAMGSHTERIRACLARFKAPITDWRKLKIGDKIICCISEHNDENDRTVCVITNIEQEDYRGDLPVLVRYSDGSTWIGFDEIVSYA